MIAALKAVHIAAILCWSAALIALPLLLCSYDHARRQVRYAEFRMLTHYGYVLFATPVAIIAIVAGTALIFAAGIFDLWLVAKLAFVSLMALCHAWIGHLIVQSAERRHENEGQGYRMPHPGIALAVALPAMAAVLWLALAKPDLAFLRDLMPGFMLAPRGQS